jgi:CBS domain containing-hemolysin-like protein
MLIYVVIVLALLFFSFVFSGSETAFLSFPKAARRKIREDSGFTIKSRSIRPRLNMIESLLADPSNLLATILFGNLLVNTTASSLFTLFVIILAKTYHLSRDLFVTIGVVVMSILLIVVCEMAPKIIALRQPARFALTTAGLINFLSNTFRFITVPLRKFGDWFLVKISKYIHKTPFPSEDDLKTLVELSEEQGLITLEEEVFLFNLVELSHRRVSEIMTPRIKMICLNKDTTISDALNLMIKEALPLYSRIPIYKENRDNIVGVLYLKDLVTKGRTRKYLNHPVEKIARPAYFVPENKSLSSLLEELRKKDSHIAIVIDEYGQTAGLVTLEDILETLLGEIQDEYDTSDEMPYKLIDTQSYLVSGDIDLNTLDRLLEFGRDIPKQAGDRLNGFIHHHWGRIPREGEVLSYRNFHIEIKEVKRKHINKVLITKIGQVRPATGK